jgi:hypothetical protein
MARDNLRWVWDGVGFVACRTVGRSQGAVGDGE